MYKNFNANFGGDVGRVQKSVTPTQYYSLWKINFCFIIFIYKFHKMYSFLASSKLGMQLSMCICSSVHVSICPTALYLW